MGLRGIREEGMSQLTKALNLPSTTTKKAKNIVIKIVVWVLLILITFITMFPYIWMVLTSFKDRLEAMSMDFTVFPKTFKLDSYFALADQDPSFLRAMLNTILIEVAVIPIGTFVTAMAAFAFAKMRLPHKHFWLLFLMSGMMVPYAALMLPQYRAFSAIGWVGTPLPLIVPGLFGNISMMFFFIQYMKSTPSALIEAGRVDGASWFRIFRSVVLPTIFPAIAAQVVFWFLGIWNDYFAPSIYLGGSEWLTLQSLLALMNDNMQRMPDYPLVMAGSVISSIPIIIIYLACQKYFVQSLAVTGMKE